MKLRSQTLGLCLALLATMPSRGDEPQSVVVTADRSARQPQAAVAGDGTIFVAFGAENAIRCATSIDGGRTYQTTEVGAVPALSLGMRRGPRIAAAGQAVVITAVGGVQGKGKDGDVLAWRSEDKGRTWAGPARVNTVEGSAREGLHAMATGPGGPVFCAWLDLRNARTEIWGARSRDGGATWERDALLYRAPEKSVCECCHPSVAVGPGGSVVVMWRNQVRGARDLYLARSSDGGATFGAAEKLGRGTWTLDACPMDGGAVAVGPDGACDTAWMRQGEAFAARAGQPERPLGPGVQPWVAAGKGGAYYAWTASRSGRLLALVPGEDRPRVLADDARDPVVASAPGGLVVAAWEDATDRGGIRAVRIDPDR